jgi:hypothetical protein
LSYNLMLNSEGKKIELSCCPKKNFWTKQKTIPPLPCCKLNGRSLMYDHYLTSTSQNFSYCHD